MTFDTTRADRLSCYGHALAKTPTIDALGAQGTRYTRCYAPAPITLPSHASLLTGLYPIHHQLRDNGVGRLDDKAQTLPELLKEAGYQTGAVIGAFVLDARFGLDQGFDFYDDDIASSDRVTGMHFAERPGGAVTDASLQWLGTVGDEPFFLWAHYFDPHSPYAPPGLHPGATEQEAYDAEITYADAELGRLLAQIKEHDTQRGTETLVVFTADHGESLHEHGEWTHGLFVYNATIRVPLIVTALGATDAPRVVDAPVSLVDVMPTLLEQLGLERPYALDGSVLPEHTDAATRTIYFETQLPFNTYGWSPLEGVVVGAEKYIAAPAPELYNVVDDASEQTNLLAPGMEPADELRRALRDVKKSDPSTPDLVAGERGADTKALRRLAALGYVGGARPRAGDGDALADPKAMVDLHDKATRASLHLEGRQWSKSASLMREVLTKDPHNFWVLDLLVQLLQHTEAFAEASDVARWRLASPLQAPWDVQLPTAVGLGAARAGQGAAALDMLERLVAKKPQSPDLRCALAGVLMQTGKTDDARPHLESALAADPKHAMTLSGMGDLSLLDGDAAGAIERYQEIISLGAPGAEVYGKLGQAYEMSGQAALAVEAYRAAVANDDTLVDIRYALAALLARSGQAQEAISHYTEVIRVRSDDPAAHYDLGLAYAGLSKLPEARRAFERAVGLKPEFGNALLNLGTVLFQQQDLNGATQAFTKAKDIADVGAEARYMLGVVAARQGSVDLTVKYYEEAIALKPGYFAPIDELSRYYLLQRNAPDAVRILKIGVEHLPDNVPLLTRLAKILSTSSMDAVRDGTAALALAARANAQVGGTRAGVLATLSAAKAEVGDFEGAIVAVEQAIALALDKGAPDKGESFRAMKEAYLQRKPYRDPAF